MGLAECKGSWPRSLAIRKSLDPPVTRRGGAKPPVADNCALDRTRPMLYRAPMSDRTEKQDAPRSAKALAAARREERLRKQLRENLKRRKAQTKARKPGDDNKG